MRALPAAAIVVTALSLSMVAGSSIAADLDELTGPDRLNAEALDGSKFVSFDTLQANLASSGYREVQLANGKTLRLSAIDTEGSEVILTVDPYTGAVSDVDYAYGMDQ